jgi:superkiller protein 3
MKKDIVFLLCILALGNMVSGCVKGDPEMHFNNGVTYFQQGDTAKAVAEFKKAVRIKPNFAAAYYNLGVCHLAPGKYNVANRYFNQTVKFDPGYVDAYYSLGMSYVAMESLPEAKQILYKGISVNPKASSLYYSIGYLFLLRGQADSARWAFKKVTQLEPDNGEAYFNFAYASTDPQHLGEAIAALRKSVACDSTNLSARYLLGYKLLNNRVPSSAERKEGIRSLQYFLLNARSGDKNMEANIKLAREVLLKAEGK